MRKGFSDINWKIEEMVTPDYFEMQYGNPKTIEKIENKFLCMVAQYGNKRLKYAQSYKNEKLFLKNCMLLFQVVMMK